MTLEEQLAEKQSIKALVLQGIKDNASAGSLLGYTTNNTKVTYEGATKTYALLNQLNAEITTIEANISKNAATGGTT
jgi:hypothetical protein